MTLQCTFIDSTNRDGNMTDHLELLIEKTKKLEMNDEQLCEQRRSFAYGNTHIENALITKEMIATADIKIINEKNAE